MWEPGVGTGCGNRMLESGVGIVIREPGFRDPVRTHLVAQVRKSFSHFLVWVYIVSKRCLRAQRPGRCSDVALSEPELLSRPLRSRSRYRVGGRNEEDS